MRTNVIFRNFHRSEYVESFIKDKVLAVVGDYFESDEGAQLTVRVETPRHRNGKRKPIFAVELLLKPSHSNVIKVIKTSADFKESVQMTTQALRNILSKMSSKKAKHNRRGWQEVVVA